MGSSWNPNEESTRRSRETIFESQVDALVHKYRAIPQRHPVVEEILKSPSELGLLTNAVLRHVNLIQCRSQIISNGQLTIYDRALLLLTQYGENLLDPGIFEFFLAEFLGITSFTSPAMARITIHRRLELEGAVNRSVPQSPSRNIPFPNSRIPTGSFGVDEVIKNEPSYTLPDDVDPFAFNPPTQHQTHQGGFGTNSNTCSLNPAVQEQIIRLMGVYYRAKDEYFRARQTTGTVGLETVRFLRDTAENTLTYLHQNGVTRHSAIPDLHHTFEETKDMAVQLTGGRRRHFDDEQSKLHRKKKRRIVDSYRPEE
ncbi:hypothetical protein BDV25DRAFT_139676 [Aspergillus avenaceus]|uniref:Uncharacterized protein n=1 Tax=Aspergillus avenaceus TaxID=36643 RepID=A0A5N6TWY9_ASPAV|nr:hypothetical protein BDV25DRAFT_139676 [Aspergillus avenaceus]